MRTTAWPPTAAPLPPDAIRQARANLRNAAHRVIQRQIAKLWDDPIATCTPAASMETTFQFVSNADLEEAFGQNTDQSTLLVPSKALKRFVVSSPDCRDSLSIVFDKPDFANERVHVLITPAEAVKASGGLSLRFRPDSFAFPFTDNAVLPDDNRFAFFVRDVSELDDSGELQDHARRPALVPEELLPADRAAHRLQGVQAGPWRIGEVTAPGSNRPIFMPGSSAAGARCPTRSSGRSPARRTSSAP